VKARPAHRRLAISAVLLKGIVIIAVLAGIILLR
jgi:hypothetical protein